MCRGCLFAPPLAPPSVGKASASSRFLPTLPAEADRDGLERPLPARPAHPPPMSPPPRAASAPPGSAKSGKSSADATLGSSDSPRDARSTASSCALSTLFTRACRSCSCAWARACARMRSTSVALAPPRPPPLPAPPTTVQSPDWFPPRSSSPPAPTVNPTSTRSAACRSALVIARPCSRPSWFFSSWALVNTTNFFARHSGCKHAW
mmetsp:Transcript_3109/g.12328  ORF Transcript_3109/g.12328 Transcript_3109/m.12328 type:complete len:207 (+) Transcript_3109:755-1375(+)